MNPIDSLFLFLAMAAVLTMQGAFFLTVVGVTRAHHAIASFFKSLAVLCIGVLSFCTIGASLAFGPSLHGILGSPSLSFITQIPESELPHLGFFLAVFLLAPAIPLGAMAGRLRFPVYLAYALVSTTLVVPLLFKWFWGSAFGNGSGFIEALGFIDRGGAAVLHLTGGAMALAGAWMAGPRMGKFRSDGRPKAMPGHHLTLSGFGILLLIFAWPFLLGGFEKGFDGAHAVRLVLTVLLAASGGFFGALVPSFIASRKFDAPFALNGVLAGMVAVSACPLWLPGLAPALVGLLAGLLVFASVLFFELVAHIDDPAGSISVHGTCGLLGALLPGFFHESRGLFHGGTASQLGVQALGALAAFAVAFAVVALLFRILKLFTRIRVRPMEELRGVDLTEHGMEAYSGFQIFNHF